MTYHCIFRLQSKKSLAYGESRDDSRKTRRKSRRKRQGAAAESLPPQLKEVVGRADGSSKSSSSSSKKKSSKFDWHRAVNSRMKDVRGAKTSYLAIEADSLKLLTVSTTPKKQSQQQRPRKLEPRRKFRGVGAVASTCVGVASKAGGKVARQPPRTPTSKTRSRRDAIFRCESSTSDDASSSYETSGKPKVAKKKQKKKQQQTSRKQAPAGRTTEQRKRASSAKTLRDNV